VKVAILLFAMALGAFGQRPPFTLDDLWTWRTPSDPRIRPDGRLLVYTERYQEKASETERSNLWIASTDGRERRPFTEGAWRDSSPRWSPGGERLAWISDRGGKARLRVRRLDAAPEIQIEVDGAPLAFAWSADGLQLAVIARPAAPPEPPSWAPPSILPRLRRPVTPPQVFVVPAAGGPVRQVSRSAAGCVGEPAWALDAKSVIAVCDGAIVSLRLDGAAAAPLTKDPGLYESPVLSPDGGRIAFLFTERKPQTYTLRKLWVMNADGTRARPLSGSLDRDAASPQWSSESRTVYFIADDRGATHVYAARNDGTVRQVTDKPERLTGFSLADTGRAVSVRSAATDGGSVYSFTVDVPTQPVTLAEPNARLLAEREIAAVEELAYDSDGQRVQAWLVKPPGFDPARKYPMLLDVADDPRRMYGVGFSLRAQIVAARGFVVLRANPRGSPGYGEQFGHLLRTRYPGDDFDDLMRGVDAAIAKGFIDAGRVSIAGGLVAAWALGHTTRFHRAVARRPIVDWAVDLSRAAPMGAMPWEDPEQYVKRSPLFSAGNFQTPTLILAPEHDAQADQLYRALAARKVPAEFVRWEGDLAVDLEATLAWLAQGAR
jgi:acylaminoacyl-peptidase